MSRKYKKNRARGTRKSTYNIRPQYVAGYQIPKKAGKSQKEYFAEFVALNKSNIQSAYNRELKKFTNLETRLPGALESFKKDYPNLEAFAKRAIGPSVSKKRVKQAVTLRLGYFEESHKQHLADLIESSEFIDELQLRINEDFDVNRLTYEGNGIYHYTTKDGNIVKFEFSDYSPTVLVFLD